MPEWGAFANLGAFGAIVAWMLLRAEPRLERIERALEQLTRAQMLTLISRPEVEAAVKEQARQLLEEIRGTNHSRP